MMFFFNLFLLLLLFPCITFRANLLTRYSNIAPNADACFKVLMLLKLAFVLTRHALRK